MGFLDKFFNNIIKHRKDTLLHMAVRTNDIDVVRFFLNKESEGLCFSREDSSVSILNLFKEEDCEKYLSKKNREGYTPLHLAIKEKAQNEIVEELVKNMSKEDLNIKNDYGETALHLAVSRRRFDVAKLLIRNGADIEMKDKYSKTIIHDVVKTGNQDMLEFLLGNGVNLYSEDSNGRIPSDRAFGYLKSARSYVPGNELEQEEKDKKVKIREKIVDMLDKHMKENLPREHSMDRLKSKNGIAYREW